MNVLLTGQPGVGKTTVVKKTLERVGGAGAPPLRTRAGGFYTQEIRVRGRRVGFEIRDLAGNRGILAHIVHPGPHRVGRYGVNVSDIQRVGVAALLGALQSAQLIVCDEIGRMEMFCQDFCDAILACLDCPTPVLGVIQARRTPFLDGIRVRSDVRIITVTTANREVLPAELAALLQPFQQASDV